MTDSIASEGDSAKIEPNEAVSDPSNTEEKEDFDFSSIFRQPEPSGQDDYSISIDSFLKSPIDSRSKRDLKKESKTMKLELIVENPRKKQIMNGWEEKLDRLSDRLKPKSPNSRETVPDIALRTLSKVRQSKNTFNFTTERGSEPHTDERMPLRKNEMPTIRQISPLIQTNTKSHKKKKQLV